MTDQEPVSRLVEDGIYTMADLRRIDRSGALARQARRQLDDLAGLVDRTRDRLQASAPPVPEDEPDDGDEDVPPAPTRRDGLGLLGDRLVPWRSDQ